MSNVLVRVCVVIPNYNDSLTLSRSAFSVLNQSVEADEVIIIDDGSTDHSLEIAAEIQTQNPRIKIIKNSKNIGVMGALNIGLSHTSADYIIFLSANDYMLDGLLEKVKKTLSIKRVGIWSALILKEKNFKRRLYPSPIILTKPGYLTPSECKSTLNNVGSWFTGTTMFFEVKSLREIGGFNPEFKGLGDMYAAMMIAVKKGSYFCPKAYGVVTEHQNGLLHGTLSCAEKVDGVLTAIIADGIVRSPSLFSNEFIKKLRQRILYSGKRLQNPPPKQFKLIYEIYLLIKYRPTDIFGIAYHRYFKKIFIIFNE